MSKVIIIESLQLFDPQEAALALRRAIIRCRVTLRDTVYSTSDAQSVELGQEIAKSLRLKFEALDWLDKSSFKIGKFAALVKEIGGIILVTLSDSLVNLRENLTRDDRSPKTEVMYVLTQKDENFVEELVADPRFNQSRSFAFSTIISNSKSKRGEIQGNVQDIEEGEGKVLENTLLRAIMAKKNRENLSSNEVYTSMTEIFYQVKLLTAKLNQIKEMTATAEVASSSDLQEMKTLKTVCSSFAKSFDEFNSDLKEVEERIDCPDHDLTLLDDPKLIKEPSMITIDIVSLALEITQSNAYYKVDITNTSYYVLRNLTLEENMSKRVLRLEEGDDENSIVDYYNKLETLDEQEHLTLYSPVNQALLEEHSFLNFQLYYLGCPISNEFVYGICQIEKYALLKNNYTVCIKRNQSGDRDVTLKLRDRSGQDIMTWECTAGGQRNQLNKLEGFKPPNSLDVYFQVFIEAKAVSVPYTPPSWQ